MRAIKSTDLWGDELFVNIQGRRQYLWRAVDEDGDVLDILVQSRRNRGAAARFFGKLLKGQGRQPRRLITDKLRSYSAAHHTVMPSVVHSTRQYENNRAEVSHQPTRQRERQMRRIQVGRTRATLLVGAWSRTEPLSGGAPPAPSWSPPITANTIVPRLGCADVCLLNDDGIRVIEGSVRPLLVNLTVPPVGLLLDATRSREPSST